MSTSNDSNTNSRSLANSSNRTQEDIDVIESPTSYHFQDLNNHTTNDERNHQINGSTEHRDYAHSPSSSAAHAVNSSNTANHNLPPIDTSHRQQSFPLPPHTATPGGPTARSHAKVKSYGLSDTTKFPRISKPVELIRTTYDIVVIGSGYGGGVAASRLARAGQNVCVLERGEERWPGEYPSGMMEAVNDLYITGQIKHDLGFGKEVKMGKKNGLYRLVLGEGQNAFVGNGLGGTSLLNANVFLKTDAGTMGLHYWPAELREGGALDEGYRKAEEMLEPAKYPEEWPELAKLNMLQRQANELGWGTKFRRVDQTTRFGPGPNRVGVEMNSSALTGQDCTGVNDGSKSSTLVNYLGDAWYWGTEIFCGCEVRYVLPHPDPEIGGYLVFYAWLGAGRDAFGERLYEDLMWVHARKCVFLGAGSLGTTEILLRSKAMGLGISDTVGKGMSGNGDLLAFGYNCDDEVNAIGREYPSPYRPVGPTITGIIDCREGHENPLDGFVIEEGAVPKALAPLLQAMLEFMPGCASHHHQGGLADKIKHKLARIGSRLLGPYYPRGSIEKTMIYLIMSHDSNQAILTLKDDKPQLKFLGVGRSDHVEYLRDVLEQATKAVGGTFIQHPFTLLPGGQEITVHPIGGACMSSNGTGGYGTTNHFGEVFKGQGEETHKGLVVTDGAVIPTALGVNPFATITALAERSVKLTAEEFGMEIDYDTRNTQQGGLLDLFGFPKHIQSGDTDIMKAEALIQETKASRVSGFEFSEVMEGFIHFGQNMTADSPADYEVAARTARARCEGARFFLSVKAWDTTTLTRRPDHSAMLTGTFSCSGLKGSPFLIQRGNFNLFSENRSVSGTKNLKYSFKMTGIDKEQYLFKGHKTVNSGVAFNPFALWRSTSTLYVSIHRLDETVIGRGILHISPMDLISEALTLRPSGDTLLHKGISAFSFAKFFTQQAAGLFFTPFAPLQYPLRMPKGFINLCVPDEIIAVNAFDGVRTYMHKWNSAHPNPHYDIHDLFMIPGAAVDHQIFSLQTIEHNAVEYFTALGYRVWVLTHRIGMNARPSDRWTTFDARLDILEALSYIRSIQTKEKGKAVPIYTIAHCMGSVAFASGLLDGTIPASWILGITCSQVFMNPEWSSLNILKVKSPVSLTGVYKALGGNWFPTTSSEDDTLLQKVIDQALRFYPTEPKELCNNIACHRVSFIFGRCWNHGNLNKATHDQIDRFLGGVTMHLEELLMHMGEMGYVTTNFPSATNMVTAVNKRRLKGIPIFFFSGGDNKVLRPESTCTSYEILRDAFGAKHYEREVVDGYGHLDCWMGTNAYKDVFPRVAERVERMCRGEESRARREGREDV